MVQKKNKFNAVKATYRGMTFDSRKELKRYLYLLHLQKSGVISQLRRQVRFRIIPPLYGMRQVCHAKTIVLRPYIIDRAAYYTCDFLYRENGKIIIEDVKSAETAKLKDYILRRKLVIRMVYSHNARRGRDVFEFRECGMKR